MVIGTVGTILHIFVFACMRCFMASLLVCLCVSVMFVPSLFTSSTKPKELDASTTFPGLYWDLATAHIIYVRW